jgi:hypothetical protein
MYNPLQFYIDCAFLYSTANQFDFFFFIYISMDVEQYQFNKVDAKNNNIGTLALLYYEKEFVFDSFIGPHFGITKTVNLIQHLHCVCV